MIDRRADRELGRGRNRTRRHDLRNAVEKEARDVGRRIEDDAQPVTVNARQI